MVVTFIIISHGYMCHTALQVLLFTATMPEGVQEAGAKWQRQAVSIHLAPGEMSISQTITQVHKTTSRNFCKNLVFFVDFKECRYVNFISDKSKNFGYSHIGVASLCFCPDLRFDTHMKCKYMGCCCDHM